MGAKLPSTPQMVNDKQHTPRPHSSLIPPAASKRLAQTGTECPTPSAKTTLRPALLSSACCSALGDRALSGVAVLPILARLGVANRTEAVAIALRKQLVKI